MTSQQREQACAYIRVSKVGARGDDLLSPDLQLHEIQQHADRQGYDIVKVVQDIDKSGRDFAKRRVDEIVSDIRDGIYSKVLLWKWSRWARNSTQAGIYLAKVENSGGSIEAATEHFDPATAYGKFNRTFFLALAELQSDQIGESWKETLSYRRRMNLPHTSAPRFGYVYKRKGEHPEAPGYFIESREKAELIRGAYERVIKRTVSVRGLAAEWNEQGITTVAGKKWSPTAMRTMLDTGFAAGLIRERSKPPKDGQAGSRRLAAFDLWRAGKHDPIIDIGTWTSYVELRKETAQEVPRLRAPKHALSGMIYCCLCGRRLKTHYSGQDAKFHQWVCADGRTAGHRPVTISNKKALKAVMDWLESEAVGGQTVTEDAKRRQKAERDFADERRRLEKVLQKVVAGAERLQEGWLNRDFTREFFERKRDELDEEKNRIEAAIARSGSRDARLRGKPTVADFRGVLAEFPGWAPNFQRAYLAEVLAGIVAFPSPGGVLLVPAWAE